MYYYVCTSVTVTIVLSCLLKSVRESACSVSEGKLFHTEIVLGKKEVW